MHKVTKLPLYLGISVLVISVLFSVVKLGEQVSISSSSVKATSATANLSLSFISPDKISLMLNADKPVAGIDAVISFDKNKIAVLMGDYLLSRGLMLAVDGNDFDFLRVITNTVKRMSEGELLQINKTRKLNIDEETYFRIISDKTASLLSTCCEIGARASTDDGEKITALKEFGENLGIAFQIRDDILDFIGTKNIFGKSLGADIKEKKITLPLIYALKNAPQEESQKIINLLKSKERKTKVDVVIKFVKMYEGIEYSEKVALEYSKAALSKLEQFLISESRLSLESLVGFVVERKN